jgi:hypothetical protein
VVYGSKVATSASVRSAEGLAKDGVFDDSELTEFLANVAAMW